MKLNSKTAIVTGASRGIGAAIALNLAKQGVNLVLVGREAEILDKVAKECQSQGVETESLVADLSNRSVGAEIIEHTIKRFQQLHVLINNAGRFPSSNDPVECDLEEWDNTLDVNFRCIYYLTKFAVPMIAKNPEGAVINISSMSATMTYKNGGIYCSSKHALKAYTGCLFENIREQNIKVCSIFPGFVNTVMARKDGLNEDLMIQPQDVADTVYFVLKSSPTVCPTEIKLRPQRSPYV